MKNSQPFNRKSPAYYVSQKKGGRSSLLFLLVCTAVNILLLLLNCGTYFLFSASGPYHLVRQMLLADNGGYSRHMVIGTLTVAALVISCLILAVYLVIYISSKNSHGWMMAAAILFSLDTVILLIVTFVLQDSPVESLMDILFHVLALWELYSAANAERKLKALEEEAIPAPFMQPSQIAPQQPSASQILRNTDPEKF